MALGQAPWGLWPISLLALAGLTLLVLRAEGPGAAGWVGQLAGTGYFGLALSWIVEPFLIEPEIYGWMAPFALVLISFGLALFWAVAGFAARWRGASGWPSAFRFALSLSLLELLRGYVFTGFPWVMIGHIWVDTPVAQAAAFVGPGGLTLLAVLPPALSAALSGHLIRAPLPLLAILPVWFWGQAELARPLPPSSDGVVRLVQPNAEQRLKWDPDRAESFFNRLRDLSAASPAEGLTRPDLIIWPETAVPYLLDREGGLLSAIAGSGQGAALAVGIQRAEGGRGWNSLAVIGMDGQLRAVYDKAHLVPFGEYIPFGDLVWDWFGIAAFASQLGRGYSAGEGPALLDFGEGLGKGLPLICYEAIFPQDLRAAPDGARWILQITNDAWFGTRTGPWQHLAQARLRAIEQGLPFLRAANTGISAVIDARGRILSQLDLGQMGFLDTVLPAARPAGTVYARTGDFPLAMVLLITLIGVTLRPSLLRRA
ncbi:MAG: apolipoprotein N-acyltransferase [Pseudorhodobacter sp.]